MKKDTYKKVYHPYGFLVFKNGEQYQGVANSEQTIIEMGGDPKHRWVRKGFLFGWVLQPFRTGDTYDPSHIRHDLINRR